MYRLVAPVGRQVGHMHTLIGNQVLYVDCETFRCHFILSISLILSYQHSSLKPSIGCMWWLVIQDSVFSCSMFTRQVHMVLLFLTNRHVRFVSWKPGGPVLTSSTQNEHKMQNLWNEEVLQLKSQQ